MYELKNWLGSVISVVRDLKYWTKQDGQSTKVEYNTSFEGGDELMFHANIDAEYTKSSTQVAEGNYSLYLNAHTDNRSHYGPNIIHQFVQTGDKLLIDLKAFYQGNTSGWNNSQGGRWVYELQNEQGGNLYQSNGTTRQWRAISITGNANSWNNYSVNFTIPQTYNADGTPYTGKIRIHSYAWVSPVHNPTYFDEFKMQILPHDYVAPTNQNYYFSAVIEMSADYHEFGQTMEGRGFVGSLNYRYGYQGSEKDNEVNSSNGTSYTTEFRQLDTRLGRWFSSDPVFQPWQSSYTSMDNNPINLTDVLGLLPDGDTNNNESENKTEPAVEEKPLWSVNLPVIIISNSKPSDQKTEQTSSKKNWLQRTWEKTKKVVGGIYNSIANNKAHELIQQNGLEDVFYRDDPSSISVQGETLLQYVTQEVNRANKLNEQLLNYILRRSLQDKDFYSSMLNSPAVSDELKSQLLINKIHQTTGGASEIILELGAYAIPIEGAITVVLKPISALALKGASRLLMTKRLVHLEIVAAKGGVQYTKSSLQLGQQMHKAYHAGKVGKEFRLLSGKRIDYLDIQNGIIHELKPFNPRAMKAGQNQLNMYLKELQSPAMLQKYPEFRGINWKTVLDTY